MYKIINLFLILIFAFFCLDVQAALAHAPHDVISQVAISPTYAQTLTLFIIVRGSLFKLTNGGDNWQRIVRGLDHKYALSSLSTSAQDGQTLFLSSSGDGVYKSQDGGDSWTKVNHGLKNRNIGLLCVYSHSSDIVLAVGNDTTLYLTHNGGESWQQCLNSNSTITAIAFSPNDHNQIIVGDNQGSLYFSEDGGTVWEQVLRLKNVGEITAIAVEPSFSENKRFFVGTEKGGIYEIVGNGISVSEINHGISDKFIRDIVIVPNDQGNQDLALFTSTWHKGVFYSNNGGNSWSKLSKGLTKDPQADQAKFRQPHFSKLGISSAFSQDKTLFLAGFNGLFKSTDAGCTWKKLETLSSRIITTVAVSPDYENDSTVAIATYNHEAYLSKDQGVTWKVINKGLYTPKYKRNKLFIRPPRFYSLVFSPHYAVDEIIFATLRYRFLRSTDRGEHWQEIPLQPIPRHSLRELIIVPSPNFAVDNTVYVGTYSGLIYKSTDQGASFSVISEIGHKIRSLVISPNFASDLTLYASGTGSVDKTVDSGKTWHSTTNGTPLLAMRGIEIAISPNYKVDQTIIAGTQKGLFKTQDGGESWVHLVGTAYGGSGYIEAIAISPNYQSDKTFMITVRGMGLFKTVDAGESFIPIGEELIKNNYSLSKVNNVPSTSVPIQFSPSYAMDNTIYGYGSAGANLFKSTNGGNTWEIMPIPKQVDPIDRLMTWLRVVKFVLTSARGRTHP